MKVVDLRPWPVRGWQDRTRGAGRTDPLGRLWSRVVDGFLARRRRGRREPPTGLQVVSVGNLALGGTGKTPVTMALARDLAADGRQGAVLTRGYGSGLRGPVAVTPDLAGAGDEARLMAAELVDTGWLVVQSRNREAGLRWLAARRPDLGTVLLEDGHQNAAGRHLDLLILDRWTEAAGADGPLMEPAAGPVMPWGPWRESAAGAARADVLVVEAARVPPYSTAGQPVAGFSRALRLEGELEAGTPWLAVSGIARPEAFEEGVAGVLGQEPEVAIRCLDHADFEGRLGARIVATARGIAGATTVTTAKDWIKLQSIWPADLPVVVARQELSWHGTTTLPALVGERLSSL